MEKYLNKLELTDQRRNSGLNKIWIKMMQDDWEKDKKLRTTMALFAFAARSYLERALTYAALAWAKRPS
jgi:hypothetical protein